MKKNYADKFFDGKVQDRFDELLKQAPGGQKREDLFCKCSGMYEYDITPAWLKENNEALNEAVNEFNALLLDYELAAQRNAFHAGVVYGLKQARK